LKINLTRKSKQTCNVERLSPTKRKSSIEYIVRTARSEDIDEVIRMQKTLQDDGIKVNSDLWKVEGDYVTYLEDYYKNMFKAEETKLVVAQSKNTGCLIGMGLGRIFRHNNIAPNISGEITDVWIEPQHRRKGIASKMISELVVLFKENQVEHLTVSYIKGNQKAEAFWRSFKFRPVLETAVLSVKEFEQEMEPQSRNPA